MTVLIHGHSPLLPFFPHYFKICSKGEAVSSSTRHLRRVFERNFGHRAAGICRNLDKPSKFRVGCPGVARVGGVETSYRSTVI